LTYHDLKNKEADLDEKSEMFVCVSKSTNEASIMIDNENMKKPMFLRLTGLNPDKNRTPKIHVKVDGHFERPMDYNSEWELPNSLVGFI
jgi:hypothetical protein